MLTVIAGAGRADMELKEITLQRERNKVLPADTVQALWTGVITEFRQMIERERIPEAVKNRILSKLRGISLDEYVAGEVTDDDG